MEAAKTKVWITWCKGVKKVFRDIDGSRYCPVCDEHFNDGEYMPCAWKAEQAGMLRPHPSRLAASTVER